jgi:HEAT repeat protein
VYFQVHVVQRGAVRPLIRMLEASDPRLCEMAAFALGRLAQVLIAVALVFALTENLVFLSSTKC